MTASQMVSELVSCFVAPPDAVQRKIEALAQTIPEEARQDIIDKILESETSSVKISVKHIVDACRALGVGYREARYLPAEDWVCACCGKEFKYHACPSDDDKIDKGIYDFCPDCGFQPGWTILFDKCKAMGQNTSWYVRLISDFEGAFGPKVKPHTKRIGGPQIGMTLSRGGIFWSRHTAEMERKEDKKIAIDAKMAEIDKGKRWDFD